MRDLTLKRVDAAIRRAIGGNPNLPVLSDERAIFLAGMRAAERELHKYPLADDDWATTERQQRGVQSAIRRLRKEMKDR